jgi:hypothetical protein
MSWKELTVFEGFDPQMGRWRAIRSGGERGTAPCDDCPTALTWPEPTDCVRWIRAYPPPGGHIRL